MLHGCIFHFYFWCDIRSHRATHITLTQRISYYLRLYHHGFRFLSSQFVFSLVTTIIITNRHHHHHQPSVKILYNFVYQLNKPTAGNTMMYICILIGYSMVGLGCGASFLCALGTSIKSLPSYPGKSRFTNLNIIPLLYYF